MFIWLCVCRLTGSARIKVGSSNPPPFGQCSPLPLPSFFPPLSLFLCLPAQLLLSAWRIRMLSNCYSFVAMRIHSFDSHSHSPSLKPPFPVYLCLSPTPRAYPFSSWQFLRLRQFRRLCRAILRHSSLSSSPVCVCVFCFVMLHLPECAPNRCSI